jgi:hypothetical protein
MTVRHGPGQKEISTDKLILNLTLLPSGEFENEPFSHA